MDEQKIDQLNQDDRQKPRTNTETTLEGDYTIRTETTHYPSIKMYLFSNGALCAYPHDYRYRYGDSPPKSNETLTERKVVVTDKEGNKVVYMNEALNYGKTRPAVRAVYSYNPDGTKKASYDLRYDDSGTLVGEHFETYYPSGNVKVFQTLEYGGGLTKSGQRPKSAEDSYFFEREDIGGTFIDGNKGVVQGADYLAQAKDQNSLIMQHRQEVLTGMPLPLLEMIRK
jgi:hypothetical protein